MTFAYNLRQKQTATLGTSVSVLIRVMFLYSGTPFGETQSGVCGAGMVPARNCGGITGGIIGGIILS